jgi:hypothetical protein
MTRRRVHLLTLGVLVVLLVAACEDAPPPRAARPRPARTRSTTAISCPTVSSTELHGGRLIDSELLSVTPGVHGRHLRYRLADGTVDLYLGIDIATRAEDLDFVGGPDQIGAHEVTYLRSSAVPRIQLVLWQDLRFPAPCDRVGVFTEGLDETTVRRIVEGITVVEPTAAPERADRSSST